MTSIFNFLRQLGWLSTEGRPRDYFVVIVTATVIWLMLVAIMYVVRYI